MVFIPVTAQEARGFRSGAPLGRGPAYAASSELRTAFDYGPQAEEDADFAAQVFASLRCLVDGQDRLVLAVEVGTLPAGTGERDFGEVERPGVRWRDVRAVFRDDPAAGDVVAQYAGGARGRTLTDLWSDESTHSFLAHHDLLWFDPTELDQVLAGLGDSPTKGD